MKYRVIQTFEIMDSYADWQRRTDGLACLDSHLSGSVVLYSKVCTLLKKKVLWKLVFAIAQMFVFCEKKFWGIMTRFQKV